MDEDLRERVERVEDHLRRRDLEAAWFVTDAGVSWLLGTDPGRDAADRRVVAVGCVRNEGVRAVVDAAEADRLRDEVLPDDVEVSRVEWYESSPLDTVSKSTPRPAAVDVAVPGLESLNAAGLRLPLLDSEIPAFRRLGREAAAAVERVCRELRPEDTEREVAAGIRIGLAADDIEAVSLRVGGDGRAYPRPRASDEALGTHATVSLTAARDGRHVSLARTVVFESGSGIEAAHEAAANVAAAGLNAALDASTAGDVFEGIREGYAAAGHPEAWRRGPPGGCVGYEPREWLIRPDGEARTRRPFALALTPWVDGAAYGDTVLVRADGIERLTDSGTWPTREEGDISLVSPLVR